MGIDEKIADFKEKVKVFADAPTRNNLRPALNAGFEAYGQMYREGISAAYPHQLKSYLGCSRRLAKALKDNMEDANDRRRNAFFRVIKPISEQFGPLTAMTCAVGAVYEQYERH